jgi:hypothetical protein
MGQTATMTPIDWDEFLEMLHSLPDPPSEEDHERVFDTLLEIEGREDIFGRAGAPAIYDDLNEIRFRHEHRREIQNILEMLFPWYWWEQETLLKMLFPSRFRQKREYINMAVRYYDFSQLNWGIAANLCSPQENRAIFEKLTELQPTLNHYSRKNPRYLDEQEQEFVARYERAQERLRAKRQKMAPDQYEPEAAKPLNLLSLGVRDIFLLILR